MNGTLVPRPRAVNLMAYLPQPMVGRVRLGHVAQIWTDAFPGVPFETRVGYMALLGAALSGAGALRMRRQFR